MTPPSPLCCWVTSTRNIRLNTIGAIIFAGKPSCLIQRAPMVLSLIFRVDVTQQQRGEGGVIGEGAATRMTMTTRAITTRMIEGTVGTNSLLERLVWHGPGPSAHNTTPLNKNFDFLGF